MKFGFWGLRLTTSGRRVHMPDPAHAAFQVLGTRVWCCGLRGIRGVEGVACRVGGFRADEGVVLRNVRVSGLSSGFSLVWPVSGTEFRVSGSFVLCFEFRVSDFGFRVSSFKCQVSGFGFQVWGLPFGMKSMPAMALRRELFPHDCDPTSAICVSFRV